MVLMVDLIRELQGLITSVAPQSSGMAGAAAHHAPARLVVKTMGPASSVLRDGGGFEMRELFPGADRTSDPYGLSRYLLIELPARSDQLGVWGHEAAHRLSDAEDVEFACYEAPGPQLPLGSILAGGTPPDDKEWARRSARFPASDGTGGSGVIIAHPDTGWAVHPALDSPAVDKQLQWSTLSASNNAEDPLNFVTFNGHGTSTASIMIGNSNGGISGLTPQARLIPIRCAQSVILVLDSELAEAVWYAIQQGAHVMSISLGGWPMPSLEDVIKHAVNVAQMIVAAAAGNRINQANFVAFPAAYPSCIAVGGTTPTDRPWDKTPYGPAVDIAAPAKHVWVAGFDEAKLPILADGNGTSFAAPHVASAAALWLEKHGRNHLLVRYSGVASLQSVFLQLLTATARRPPISPAPGEYGDVAVGQPYEWEPAKYGPGILDVTSLLNTPLPKQVSSRSLAYGSPLTALFPMLTYDEISARLDKITDWESPSVTAELVQIFATDPDLRHLFASSMENHSGDLGDNGSWTRRLLPQVSPALVEKLRV